MQKTTWTIDKAHSTLGFTVTHMMISKVKGMFDAFDAKINVNPKDLTDADIAFTIDTSSVNTRSKGRDDHLRSADFFNSEKHQNMTFKATKMTNKGKNNYDMTGDLTILETTKPVTFDITFDGLATDPMNNEEAAGFSGQTTISRKEFGLTWNAALETGGVVVSDDVKINIDIQIRR